MNGDLYARNIRVRPRGRGDPDWIASFLRERWGSTHVTRRGERVDASKAPAFLGLRGADRVGLATYRIEGDACEILTMDSKVRGRGLGRAFLRWIAREAYAASCRHLRLTIPGENPGAERFFRGHGFRITKVRFRADPRPRSRKGYGPLRKEVDMEMRLGTAALRSLGWYAPRGEEAKKGDFWLRHKKFRRQALENTGRPRGRPRKRKPEGE